MYTTTNPLSQPKTLFPKEWVGVGSINPVWTDQAIEELQYGMIVSAINDLRDGRKSKLMQREAKNWIREDDYIHPLSFCNCCMSLGLDEERLRQLISHLIKGGL
ncbi:hypothetical protein BC355_17625 [Vibrio cholerae]|uniref:Uncharacterized protein n=1 Tax=Vibrio cholerae TaxID=666 RepID=A0A395TFZ6_VIBCL|nr:hypothetical protein [Vibrio cholerae]EGR0468616.1 hypothetical protein [Vibrio cholerae]RGP82979.1 hypothetical protein BC355_17625 [Vibrio cholerae]RGP83319.1 hypothetical protein BC353_17585 [Vibrio cholerae]TXY52009.1 hypothetical protein FXE74_18620 [Vibrio cholerae]GIB31706.1 topoisomerase II [Vibrio cholerae]